MSLRFPNLGDSECKLLRCCGEIDTVDPNVVQILHESRVDDWLRASVRVNDVPHVIMAAFGGSEEKKSNHVHIDVVRRDYFGRQLPGQATQIGKIRDIIRLLDGQSVEVDWKAYFHLQPDDLPGLVEATKFEMRSGPFSIGTESVSFSVEGAPVYKITWEKSADNVVVMLQARTEGLISDSYIQDGYDLINSTFDKFIVGSVDEEHND